MTKDKTIEQKVAEIIEESGPGFEIYYLDGRAEGYANCEEDIISNALSNGFDDETISIITGPFH